MSVLSSSEVLTVAERARRSDAGQVRLTGRDAAALEWIEDQRAIDVVDLEYLLGALAGRERVGKQRVYEIVKRWERLGLATRKRWETTASGERLSRAYVEVTQRGSREYAGGREVQPVAVSQVPHALGVSRVRLRYERTGWAWTSERTLAAAEWRGHRPDGLATSPKGSIEAVEVELHAKTPERLGRIVRDLRVDQRFGAVRYWCGSDAVRRAVEAAAGRAASEGGDVVDRVAAGLVQGREIRARLMPERPEDE